MHTGNIKSKIIKTIIMGVIIFSILLSSVGAQAMIISDDVSSSLTNFKRGSIVYQPNLTFTDIGDATIGDNVPWYRDSVRKAYAYGIIVGKEVSIFDPEGSLTIAEAITIGARMSAIYKYGNTSQIDKYTGAEWYSKYLNYYKAENLIDGTFDSKMDVAIKRSEMVYVWSKIFNEKDLEWVSEVGYENIGDIALETAYSNEVLNFYKVGITVGYPNGDFYLIIA